jgi:hypothetical protein
MRRFVSKFAVVGALAMVLAIGMVGWAVAAIIGPDANGFGFVGKGDVQLVYGWNNKALQDNASKVDFQAFSEETTSWTCSKPNPSDPSKPDIVNQRSTTTTTQGLVTTVARENSKGKDGPVSGFYLQGWEGTPTQTTTGDVLGSCPANPSGFTYDEGSESTDPGGSGLQVTDDNQANPIIWKDIPA